MSLGGMSRDDLLAIIEDAPALFEFKGAEYRGTASGINKSRPLEIGGFEDRPELTIVINLKDASGAEVFGQDRPDVGDRITYRGTTFRVDSTETDSFEEALQLNLRSKDI